ncbi:MAG: M48 family metallopeptidase [Chloroflexota bacterium]
MNRTEPVPNIQVKPKERKLRSIYRTVITILSLYFYISIPFVILALLLVVGIAFYIFLSIGTIPIQLGLILIIMLFGSLIAIVRSVFSRVKNIPPGRQLSRIDAPELWKLVEDIAHKLQIRPVDAIYINPWPSIAVNENGSILQKLRGQGKRNLILGMSVLPELTQGQLSAILAHEYGHFSNQDTAGGDLAHQVYASLYQMAQRLIQARVTQIFNPVWLFVLGYQRLFLRVTLGASRLQEVLADRYAARTYGSQNFIDGLKSVIRQTIAFPIQANYEVNQAFGANRPVYNLYNLPAEENLKEEIEKQFQEAMDRVTSPYNSHPATKERIALVERLQAPYSPMQENRQPALHLFPNYDALQLEMTGILMKNVKK